MPQNSKSKKAKNGNAAVIYPEISLKLYMGPDGGLTEQVAKGYMGWQTEGEYQAEQIRAHPGSKPEHWAYGDDFMCKDEDGNKVRCKNNLDNRPFEEGWGLQLMQMILRFQWAGPTTLPGETINGSTIVISRTGKVESGQHSLFAVIRAYQKWWKNRDAYPEWANVVNSKGELTGPYIETIVVLGTSEDARVLMTTDNCKPRTERDVFYTSPLFRKLPPFDRKECSRMAANGLDLMWKRTGAKGYKTHPEIVGFMDRHKKFLKCIEHLFSLNEAVKGRKITVLRLSPGQCAAIMYLMGCSASDGESYRNGFPPKEKGLSWDNFDQAKEFWTKLANAEDFAPVRIAIGRLFESSTDNEDNVGMGGRLPEKLAVIAKAWDAFQDGYVFSETDLHEDGVLYLSYSHVDQHGNLLPDGKVSLLDRADFKGIDVPDDGTEVSDPPAPEGEDLESRKEDARRDRAIDTLESVVVNNIVSPDGKVPSQRAIELAERLKKMRSQ